MANNTTGKSREIQHMNLEMDLRRRNQWILGSECINKGLIIYKYSDRSPKQGFSTWCHPTSAWSEVVSITLSFPWEKELFYMLLYNQRITLDSLHVTNLKDLCPLLRKEILLLYKHNSLTVKGNAIIYCFNTIISVNY